jgi:hypothetical protein
VLLYNSHDPDTWPDWVTFQLVVQETPPWCSVLLLADNGPERPDADATEDADATGYHGADEDPSTVVDLEAFGRRGSLLDLLEAMGLRDDENTRFLRQENRLRHDLCSAASGT